MGAEPVIIYVWWQRPKYSRVSAHYDKGDRSCSISRCLRGDPDLYPVYAATAEERKLKEALEWLSKQAI